MSEDRTRGAGRGANGPSGSSHQTEHGGCKVEIRIDAQGPVNIYNCTSPPSPADAGREPCPPPPCGAPAGPISPGQCVPLAIGSKPKQSLRSKLDALLENAQAPSAVAAGFFQHARRFAAGRPAANALETQAFAIFRSMPEELRSILACSVDSFDAISRDERDRLFDPAIPQDVNVPLDADTLATAFVRELKHRVGVRVFGEPDALEQERPGRNRFFDTAGSESFEVQLRLCTVNGLRTNEYVPALTPGR